MPAPPTRSPPATRRRYLRASGVAKIQGFFLNSTHFDWTSNEIRYGDQISRMTGGKHFVVNTGENGHGPLRPRDIVSRRQRGPVQPARPRPRTAADRRHRLPQRRHVRLDRATRASPAAAASPARRRPAMYWPAYALMLVRDADFNVAVAAGARLAALSVAPRAAGRA